QVTENYDLGYTEGEEEGYQIGYDVGYSEGIEDLAENGYYLRDPTYQEAMTFIQADKTDLNPYTPTYVCYDFTADFNKNAAEQGYRCGFVYIEYATSAHAIACFNTTDQGLIYVEPQNDHIVNIAIGQAYLGMVIVDMGIIW
ncbi:MAG: Yae1 family protein, partial [Candidatus Bathyarchaeota archaeon]|nr:Yae1 family protein [Candidatus Bathyarchaeota archaeon]